MSRATWSCALIALVCTGVAVSAQSGPPPGAPPNDDFANAINLGAAPYSALGGSVAGTTAGATREAGDPVPAADVWYRWTAPRNGRVTFSLSPAGAGGPSTDLAVLRGSSLAGLTSVGGGPNGSASLQAVGGQTYDIAVATGGSGFDLTWSFLPAPAISRFSPLSGPAGTTVTIIGSDFAGTTSVQFGAATARFVLVSSAQIRATVPVAATSGPIRVTTAAGTAISAAPFTVGYVVSGKITYNSGGVPHIRVRLSGAAAGAAVATVTTDANGAFNITGLRPGSYTIAPDLAGYGFVPTVGSVTIATASVRNVDFAAMPQGKTISGRIATASGAGMADVPVRRSGSPAMAFTNADGNYIFGNVPTGAYTVTPALSGYSLTPDSRTVTVGAAVAANVDFTATRLVTIRGRIGHDAQSGFAGVRVLAVGEDGTRRATTDASGGFSFSVPPGQYTLIPTLDSYSFTPSSRDVQSDGNDVVAADFIGVKTPDASFMISGRVTLSSGQGVQNVRVVRDGGNGAFAFTNAAGEYYFPGLPPGVYHLVCLLSNYRFTPERLSVSVQGASAPAASFLASRISPIATGGGSLTATRSTVALSSASASAATQTIRLQFSQPLDSDTASDPADFTVVMDGLPLPLESASYDAARHMVTLLTAAALRAGDPVLTAWSGLHDAHGAVVDGQTALVVKD